MWSIQGGEDVEVLGLVAVRFETISGSTFGNQFVGRVANPDEVLFLIETSQKLHVGPSLPPEGRWWRGGQSQGWRLEMLTWQVERCRDLVTYWRSRRTWQVMTG